MPSRFWNCTRPADTSAHRTKKYPRHEVCILFYRNVEVLLKYSSSLCAFFLHLWKAACYLQIVPNSFSQMENAFFKVPFAAKTSTLYEIRNNKDIIRRYTTLLQQIQSSYMFRLHKAAIIRQYILENVKKIYIFRLQFLDSVTSELNGTDVPKDDFVRKASPWTCDNTCSIRVWARAFISAVFLCVLSFKKAEETVCTLLGT